MQAEATTAPLGARLMIPTSLEPSADYKTRVGRMLSDADTHIYIDTSFLMWATKIGPASRGELLDWLRTDLNNRAHVPTWTAHEYLRHHVAGTLVEELDAKSAELATLVGGSFNYFRPFLDDPALPAAEGFDRLRASAREAINTFDRVIKTAKDWRRAYPDHAKQIIDYINERVLDVGGLYEDLAIIVAEGAARFEGRIPPGFKDRHKKGTSTEGDASNDGANRYGDLIFWKEAIRHAQSVGANAAIILSNDRKNDWRMGGEKTADIDAGMLALRKSWRPVPVIHPMLALEAKAAGIGDVALLDSQYLAAYLRDVDETRLRSFADVAIVPDPPAPQTDASRRADALARRQLEDELQATAEAAAAMAQAAADGFRFADDPAVNANKTALSRALFESRKALDQRSEALVARTRAGAADYSPMTAILTEEALAGMDQNSLARLTRALHDRVLDNVPGFEEALADLAGLLPELPPGTASALTLGLMASMYLEPGSGDSRIPPRSPINEALFEATQRPYGDIPAQVVAKRLLGNDNRPLHVPLETVVECRFATDPDSLESDVLRSLRIAGVETLMAAQPNMSRSLRVLVGGERCTGDALLQIAAGLFCLPWERLQAGGDETSEYLLPEAMGFREPSTLSRAREET